MVHLIANEGVGLHEFIKSNVVGKENNSAINTSIIVALKMTQEVQKLDDDLDTESSTLICRKMKFEPDEEPLNGPQVLQYISLRTPHHSWEANDVGN